MQRANVFTIASGAPFLKTFANSLFDGHVVEGFSKNLRSARNGRQPRSTFRRAAPPARSRLNLRVRPAAIRCCCRASCRLARSRRPNRASPSMTRNLVPCLSRGFPRRRAKSNGGCGLRGLSWHGHRPCAMRSFRSARKANMSMIRESLFLSRQPPPMPGIWPANSPISSTN